MVSADRARAASTPRAGNRRFLRRPACPCGIGRSPSSCRVVRRPRRRSVPFAGTLGLRNAWSLGLARLRFARRPSVVSADRARAASTPRAGNRRFLRRPACPCGIGRSPSSCRVVRRPRSSVGSLRGDARPAECVESGPRSTPLRATTLYGACRPCPRGVDAPRREPTLPPSAGLPMRHRSIAVVMPCRPPASVVGRFPSRGRSACGMRAVWASLDSASRDDPLWCLQTVPARRRRPAPGTDASSVGRPVHAASVDRRRHAVSSAGLGRRSVPFAGTLGLQNACSLGLARLRFARRPSMVPADRARAASTPRAGNRRFLRRPAAVRHRAGRSLRCSTLRRPTEEEVAPRAGFLRRAVECCTHHDRFVARSAEKRSQPFTHSAGGASPRGGHPTREDGAARTRGGHPTRKDGAAQRAGATRRGRTAQRNARGPPDEGGRRDAASPTGRSTRAALAPRTRERAPCAAC